MYLLYCLQISQHNKNRNLGYSAYSALESTEININVATTFIKPHFSINTGDIQTA
jgi:hypothetical protein